MKITADSVEELEQAIDAHALNGWAVSERHGLSGLGYTATLIHAPEAHHAPLKIYQCGLCGLKSALKDDICVGPHDLPFCIHAAALLGVKEVND